jgi:hypothetical protein
MKIYRYVALISFCLLINCSKKTIENNHPHRIVSVDENISEKKMFYSALFDSLKYVSLKTSDSILIKEVTKIKYFNDVIYVLDRRTQVLFAFNLNGELIWKIQHVGRGPKEYSQLVDFDVNEKSKKLLLFSRYEKIQVYDFDGNFIEEWKFPFRGISFATSENRMYIYTGGRVNFINNENEKYNLLFFDNKNILKGEIYFKKELESTMIYNSPNSFCKYDNEIRFFMPFSNNIYSIKEDSVYVEYQFDFGKYNLPCDYFDGHTPDDLVESNYTYGLNSYWENKKYSCFNITSGRQNCEILYLKNKKVCFKGSFYDDLAYCFPTFFHATDDYIIGARYAEDLFMEYNHAKEARQGTILEKVISEITEDDNPIIFFYYFKSCYAG